VAKTERFNIGFLLLNKAREELFLSVTPGFEHGPGIQRDGITPPRMRDPHSVPRIMNPLSLPLQRNLRPTTDPYAQRAGTWTLYHHVKHFLQFHGDQWTIIGVQSNGDLTMNPWHVAYIGKSHVPRQDGELCALLTENDPQEPVGSRIYRSLIKWTDCATAAKKGRYECLNLRIEETPQGRALKINDSLTSDRYDALFAQVPNYNTRTRDVAPLIEFTLSGKPVVEEGIELSLANAIDRFEDIRHIFNLPTVNARGFYRGQEVKELNFGEYQLFANLNERRATLSSPVIIDLDIEGRVMVSWNDISSILRKRHFKETLESPTRRGQFRRYLDLADKDKVEIFFPYNVYPFGVLGVQESETGEADGNIVCLSSGGLSGRVGNTLEGIARIMFDFFGCVDAMVLDEGYDVFFVANPSLANGGYKYTNDEMLKKILTFTKERVEGDQTESLKTSASYFSPNGLKSFPLNELLLQEVDDDFAALGSCDYSDVLLVEPKRSQMRSVLIFAVRKESEHKMNAGVKKDLKTNKSRSRNAK